MHESVKPDDCHFCGEQASVAYTKEDGIYVHCQFCGAEGPKTGNSEADAISAWHHTNGRPSQDAKPVAWRWRVDERAEWNVTADKSIADYAVVQGNMVEPLYSSPPLAIEALREALKPFAEIAELFGGLPPQGTGNTLHEWATMNGRAALRMSDCVRASDALKSFGDSDGR